MKRGNRWRGIAMAVLAGAVIMAGCASAKDGGTSTADDSAVGTVEQFTGQAVVPVTETASSAAEPATDGETPDPVSYTHLGVFLLYGIWSAGRDKLRPETAAAIGKCDRIRKV